MRGCLPLPSSLLLLLLLVVTPTGVAISGARLPAVKPAAAAAAGSDAHTGNGGGGGGSDHVLRGARPDIAARLLAHADRGRFACLNAPEHEFPLTSLNDDYCDCPDGSDEPGTAACAGRAPPATALHFYCENRWHLPAEIPASRVNDGVCDCCDGSDEWQTPSLCRDTCEERGRAWRAGVAQEATVIRAGLRERAALVRRAADMRQQAAERVAEVRGELARAEREEARAAKWKSRADAYASAFAAQSAGVADDDNGAAVGVAEQTEQDSVMVHQEEAEEGGHHEGDGIYESVAPEEHDDHDHDGDDHVYDEFDAYHDDDDDTDADDDGERPPPNEHESVDDEAHTQFGRREDDVADGNGDGRETATSASAAPPASAKKPPPMPTPASLEECGSLAVPLARQVTRMPERALEHLVARAHYAAAWIRHRAQRLAPSASSAAPPVAADSRAVASSLVSSLSATTPQLTRVRRNATACRRLAAAAHASAVGARDRARTELERTRADLARSYGPDDVYFALRRECFTRQVAQYEYEVCLFDAVRQREHGASVRLGAFRALSDNGREMKFDGGGHCWQGPARRATVQVECGERTEIVAVDEPEKCAYRVRMTSPAACSEGELTRVEALIATPSAEQAAENGGEPRVTVSPERRHDEL